MTGERVVVRYAMVFDPLANHACKIVQRADGAYVSYDDYVALRAQVAALAVVMDALGEESINCDNLHHGPKDYHAAFSEPCPVQARVKAALDAARGGEG